MSTLIKLIVILFLLQIVSYQIILNKVIQKLILHLSTVVLLYTCKKIRMSFQANTTKNCSLFIK